MSREFFVADSLLEPGNKPAVRLMAEYALESIAETRQAANVRHDVALDWLAGALQAIGGGEEPNQAFGWEQGRRAPPYHNFEFRNYDIKTTVRDRMRATGESKTVACENVSSESDDGEFLLGSERIKDICRGITKDSEIRFLENPFPIDPEPYRRKRRE